MSYFILISSFYGLYSVYVTERFMHATFNEICLLLYYVISLQSQLIKSFISSKYACQNFGYRSKVVKKLLLVLPALFALNGCVAPNANNTTATTSQQLGMTALKVAVNAKCINEINTLPAWKTATRLMTTEQRENIQTNVCGCVSEKAPNSVTTVELATAAIDPTARATIVSQVVSETVNACVAEALNK